MTTVALSTRQVVETAVAALHHAIEDARTASHEGTCPGCEDGQVRGQDCPVCGGDAYVPCGVEACLTCAKKQPWRDS